MGDQQDVSIRPSIGRNSLIIINFINVQELIFGQ